MGEDSGSGTKDGQVVAAALAGLLHDVGKFAQRAGWAKGDHAQIGTQMLEDNASLGHLVPERWHEDVIDAVAYHNQGDHHKPIVQAVRVANWLAASEWEADWGEWGDPATTPLIPIVARLSLDGLPPEEGWGYRLSEATSRSVLFPQVRPAVTPSDYATLWQESLSPRAHVLRGKVDSFFGISGLMDMLAQTMSYVPSATPWEDNPEERAIPDIPLYHHLHLTAAIAVCLTRLLPDQLEALHRAGRLILKESFPVARLVKVDFSGIQAFIYRITEPADERTFRHSARRLRGRSLHLTLLNQMVGDWLLRRLGMPPTNLLYAAGGVLELLLPPDLQTAEQLEAAMAALEAALWEAFDGDLGSVYAEHLMRPPDFADVRHLRAELEEQVALAKRRKWRERLERPDFFRARPLYHACSVCGLTPVPNEGQSCSLCNLHADLGEILPHTAALVHTVEPPLQESSTTVGLPAPLSGYVTLCRTQELGPILGWVGQADREALVRGINVLPEMTAEPGEGAVQGVWTTANTAPLVDGKVLDFEGIADLSRGTPLLGVLRGDADRMGLWFSHGFQHPTFSRTAVLSQTMARFFGPYLNELAATLTQEWRDGLDDGFRQTLARRGFGRQVLEDLESLFYVLYAGGDDLFVVGPWDQMVTFALSLGQAFEAYTCHRMTLSAGLIFVKPHFPTQHFARLAQEAERDAKAAGRDRLAVFGRALPWTQAARLIEMAQRWVGQIEEGRIPRSLIHDLGREAQGRVFTPTLYYTMVRRLRGFSQQERRAFAREVLDNLSDLVVPVSYASLITRKE